MALSQTPVHMLMLLLTSLTIIDFPSRAEGEELVLADGTTHTLSCTTPSGGTYTIGWVTNNGHLPDEFTQGAEEILDYGMLRRNITVTAKPNVNNTTLSCVVTHSTSLDSSRPILMIILIQGKLQLPIVQYTMEEQRVVFSWYPPFSYDITNVEPDISHYEVNVTNVVDHTVTTSITNDTSFLLESTYCQLHTYIVEIAAVNVVGVGEKYTSPPITLDELHLSIIPTVSLSGEDPEIMLQVNTSCKEIKLSITFICIMSPKPPLTINHTIIDSEDTILSSVDIELNEYYQMIIGVEDSPTFNHALNLSTFDVQSVNFENQGNEYKFRCYLATGSRARGCRIVLRHEVNGECELKATRSEGEREAVVMATLANGHYSVMVYDIEEEESEGQANPAYTTHLVVVDSVDSKAKVCLGQSASDNDTAEDMTKGSNTTAIAIGTSVVLVLALIAGIGIVLFSLRRHKASRKYFQEEKGVTTEEHEYVPSPRAQEQLTQTNDSPMTQQDAIRNSLPSEDHLMFNNNTEGNIGPPTEPQQQSQSQEENYQFSQSETNNAATLPQPFTAPGHPSSALPSLLQPQNSDSSSTETSPPPSATSTVPLLPPKPPAVVARQTHYADVEVKPRDKRLQSPPRTNDQNVLYSIIDLKTTSP